MTVAAGALRTGTNGSCPSGAQRDLSDRGDLVLDEREFYWTAIDGPVSGDPNEPRSRLVLDEVFERDLPEPIEGLAVRYASLRNAVVGCAVKVERVQAALEAGALVMRPRTLPTPILEAVSGRATDVARSLNVLVGDFEPCATVALRAARRRLLCAGATAALALLACGLWIGAKGLERRVANVVQEASRALVNALPTTGENVGPDAARLRLQRERRHLERARGAEAERARLLDAADGLVAVLSAWPKELETRVSSVQVSATQITLSVEVPDAAAAETLSAALRDVRGWILQPPRTEITGAHARITAILRPNQRSQSGTTSAATEREGRS
jgi:hypothetical protein